MRGSWLVLAGVLAVAGCGGNNSLDQARKLRAAGDARAALVEYGRAIKADPRSAAQIKEEAELIVSEQIPRAFEMFKGGRFAEVTAITSSIVNLPSDYLEPYLLDGLARLAIAVRDAPFDAVRFQEGLSSLNQYLMRLPADQRNARMLCPPNLYQWLVARHTAFAQVIPGASVAAFRSDFEQPLLVGESAAGGGDLGFVMRGYYLDHIARALASGASDAPARVERLARWMGEGLLPLAELDPGIHRPLDVLFAARGTPLQLAWTGCELARYLGLEAYVRADSVEGQASPRYLVSLWLGEGWRHFDPVAGIWVAEEPTARSTVFVAGEAKGFYPRIGLLQDTIAGTLGVSPPLIVPSDRGLAHLLLRLHGAEPPDPDRWRLNVPVTQPDRPTIDILPEPFELELRLRVPAMREAYRVGRARYSRYELARMRQLEGRHGDAVAAFDLVPAAPEAPPDVPALRALSLAVSGPPEVALAALDQALAGGSPWAPLLHLQRVRLLRAAGRTDEAQAAAQLVEGPRAELARQLLTR